MPVQKPVDNQIRQFSIGKFRLNFFQYTGGQWIYKLDESGNRAVKVPITVGRQNPRQYEIIEGLKAGDRVITSGYDTFGDAEELILK